MIYKPQLVFDEYWEYRYKILNDLLDCFLNEFDFKKDQQIQSGELFIYCYCNDTGWLFWIENELNKYRVIFDYVNKHIIIESDSNKKLVKDVYRIVENYVKL